jgi:hypothetical protein
MTAANQLRKESRNMSETSIGSTQPAIFVTDTHPAILATDFGHREEIVFWKNYARYRKNSPHTVSTITAGMIVGS